MAGGGGWRWWLEVVAGWRLGGWREWWLEGGWKGWVGFTVRCGTVSLLHGSVRYGKLPARFGAVR